MQARTRGRGQAQPDLPVELSQAARDTTAQPDFAARSLALLLFKSARGELREMTRNVYFAALATGGVLALVAGGIDLDAIYGAATYPVTYMVLELIRAVFGLFMLAITIFYAGELVWRERETRVACLLYTSPSPRD